MQERYKATKERVGNVYLFILQVSKWFLSALLPENINTVRLR
jgi:hypothetical protein